MAQLSKPALIAGGDINTCRFLTGSGNFTAVESNSTELPIGISGEATRVTPTDGSSTLAAADGDHFEWYGLGDTCLLKIGSGGCTAWDLLKPDDSGQGVTAGAGDKYGAQTLETRAAGELARVMIVRGELET